MTEIIPVEIPNLLLIESEEPNTQINNQSPIEFPKDLNILFDYPIEMLNNNQCNNNEIDNDETPINNKIEEESKMDESSSIPTEFPYKNFLLEFPVNSQGTNNKGNVINEAQNNSFNIRTKELLSNSIDSKEKFHKNDLSPNNESQNLIVESCNDNKDTNSNIQPIS